MLENKAQSPSLCLLSPALEDRQGNNSKNLGDLIIGEAIEREINTLFPDWEKILLHTHKSINEEELLLAQNCCLIFVGGSNILGAPKAQWPLSTIEQLQLARVITFGTGWHRYEEVKIQGQNPYILK
jgi:hypothetical protein